MKPVLSCHQTIPLLEARTRGANTARCSFDLGRTALDVQLDSQGVQAESLRLTWTDLQRIADTDSVCFTVADGDVQPLRIFSSAADRSFQLWPTTSSPALLISGFLMHRVRDVPPHEGAARMVRALGKLRGRVLDTTTGLGYAAIAAAANASQVVTIEIEPAVSQLAQQNPWSTGLFERPNIERREGDSRQLVPTFEPSSFAAVIHDPPAVNLAGELYSAAFYAAVLRLLAPRGRFFHYVGDAESASGSRTTRGVVKRLREVGFSQVRVLGDAFGVLASA